MTQNRISTVMSRTAGRVLPAMLALLLVSSLLPAAILALPPQTATAVEPADTVEQAGLGDPVAGAGVDGLSLFIRRADGSVWRRTRDTHGRWDNWTYTGGVARGNPTLGRISDSRLVVFVRGTDNRLWRQVQAPNGAWGPWRSMGAPAGVEFDSDPAVAINDNRAANAMRSQLRGTIEQNTDPRMEVFIRDTDGGLWHRAQRAVGDSAWTGWRQLTAGFAGKLTGDPVAVTGGDGRIALFSRDGNGYLRHSAQVRPGRPGTGDQPYTQWSGWGRLTEERGVREGSDIAVAVNVVGKFGTLLQVFANGGKHLWTMTQSVAGDAAHPRGKWAESEALRAAFLSSPVAASGPDGRLHVFGLRSSDGRVAYRSQVSPVAPFDPDNPKLEPDPNGNWYACCTAWTGGPATRGMTVVYHEGRLEAFLVRRGDGSVFHRRQLSTGRPQSPPGTWHNLANLNPVAAPCANTGSLNCLSITSPYHGTILDGSPRDDSRVMHYENTAAPTANQSWRVTPAGTDGTVRVENRGTGRCLQDGTGSYAETQPCDASQSRQQWYLRAVGGDDVRPARLYQLVSTVGPDRCATPIGKWDEVWTDRCSDAADAESHLLLGLRDGRAPGVMDLAIEYAAHRCDEDDSSVGCRWVEDPSQTGSAYRAGEACVASQVVYNSDDSDPAHLEVIRHRMTGVEASISATIAAMPWGVGMSFTGSVGWVEEDTTGSAFSFPVPARHFGWAVQEPVKRSSVGHWEFTVDGRAWSVPGEVVAYAKDGTDNVDAGPLLSMTSSSPPVIGRCRGI